MKVLILGRNEITHAVAQRLVDSAQHEVVAVITARATPEYKKGVEDFEALAGACGAEFLATQVLDEKAQNLVRESGAEIGVSVNWPTVIGAEFMDMLPRGVINAHFGALPRFRGNAVTNWAILTGEKEIAFTLHFMAPGLVDAGPILMQQPMALTGDTTIDDINCEAERQVPDMFLKALDGLDAGTLQATPQPEQGGFRCRPRLPCDGNIPWAVPVANIHALVRSLTKPYPGAFTFYRTAGGALEKLYVWKTRIVSVETTEVGVPGHVILNDPDSGESHVLTGRGVIALCEVSHHGDQPFAPGTVWKSTRLRLGMDVQQEIFNLVRKLDKQ